MKYINLIVAILMGASLAVAVPTLEKDSIHGLAGSFDSVASMALKAFNISVPDPSPDLNSIPVAFDGALVKTRDPSSVTCTVWENDFGKFNTQANKVRSNIDQLRGRSDKPPAVDPNDCKMAICSAQSGVALCTSMKNPGSYTVDSWGLVADAVEAVLDTCNPNIGNDRDDSFQGAALYGDVWLAVVMLCTMED